LRKFTLLLWCFPNFMAKKTGIHPLSNRPFEQKALEIFRFQARHNAVYRSFLSHLKTDIYSVNKWTEIPFLPIQFFKTHRILSVTDPVQKCFVSSGTSGTRPSRHEITDLSLYQQSFRKGFAHFYGQIEDYTILALLPAYLEREGSSLVYMVDDLIQRSGKPASGFYLHNLAALKAVLLDLEARQEKTLLIGVSFALLDLVEKYAFKLRNTLVMETGGMKGRRKELVRSDLHKRLQEGFGVPHIHAEYGMTELLSQAYASQDGAFECPPWMRICIRDPEDALSLVPDGRTGGINVMDLANINSCSFIATQDLGKKLAPNRFEVLGRFDHAEIRGCNLMVV